MMDAKDSCIFRANWMRTAQTIRDLRTRCVFYEAVLQYALTGMKMEASPEISLALELIYSLIDIDREKYEKKIEKRREAGKRGALITNEKRWGYQEQSANIDKSQQTSANADKSQQTSHDTDTVTDTVTDTDTGTDKDNDFKKLPLTPKKGRDLSFEDFFRKVSAIRIPKRVEELAYGLQYAWRMSEDMVGYGMEVAKIPQEHGDSDHAFCNMIQKLNGQYKPEGDFQRLRLAYDLTRVKPKVAEAFIREQERCKDEPGIYATLDEKVRMIIDGAQITSLQGFVRSRKQ